MKHKTLYPLALLLLLLAVLLPAAAQEETEAAPEPLTLREAAPDPAGLQLVQVARGLNRPLYLASSGDGTNRLFVLEQSGRIYILQDDTLLSTPFLDLTNLVHADVFSGGYTERGLLGMVFHPDYAENGRLFVHYSDRRGANALAEYRVMADDPDRADPDSARIILIQDQPFSNHNGGQIAFGPDGYLYMAIGDGGRANDPVGAGQDPYNLLGTIIRIDVDGDAPYSVPADNPFVSNRQGAPEVWAWGLRNPWRFSFDRATGDLYIADVGQNQWEEVNFQPADSPGGENYGWVAYEGSHAYIGPAASPVVMPVAEYDRSGGCSITGGYVYRGQAVPDLEGVYLYGDYCSGRIWGLYRDLNGQWQTLLLLNSGMSISSFGEDEDGELYVVNYGGSIHRLQAAP